MKAGKTVLIALMCAILVAIFTPVASADIGPKPSVRVSFTDLPDALCYGTLISSSPSTGPNSVWDGDEEHIDDNGLDPSIWRAFVEHEDPDGFHFLQIAWCVSETGEIAWTYYPPSEFKILLYFPESGEFASSGVLERYAFDTYYNVDMTGFSIGDVSYDGEKSNNDRIDAHRSYEYLNELGDLLVRLLITLVIEIGIAALFELRRGALAVVAVTNILTQLALNIALSILTVGMRDIELILSYIGIEALIIAVEAGIYAVTIGGFRRSLIPKKQLVIYAAVANSVSFLFGLILAEIVPQFF